LLWLRLAELEALNVKERENILNNIINLLADENIRLTYKADVLSIKGMRERIMAHLSIMQEKRGKRSFDLGMNQEQFAQYLCVNRSALSKELNRLKAEGIIAYKNNSYTVY
jgi:CRP-like cAMP-binding protein